MTKEEFTEKWMAAFPYWTPVEMEKFGRVAKPCHCGDNGCEGWRMGWVENDPRDDLDGV